MGSRPKRSLESKSKCPIARIAPQILRCKSSLICCNVLHRFLFLVCCCAWGSCRHLGWRSQPRVERWVLDVCICGCSFCAFHRARLGCKRCKQSMHQRFRALHVHLGHNSLEPLSSRSLCARVLGDDAGRPRLEKAAQSMKSVTTEASSNIPSRSGFGTRRGNKRGSPPHHSTRPALQAVQAG